ncbi:MAG: thiamine-phosphate kinase [Actinomycetota bacterium]|nr:thiamine-phosphate kinase [Actinomycetota bacterium]
MTEAQIIELIREMAEESFPGVVVGIGDDAAVFQFSHDNVLLSIDSFFEGIHFDFSTHNPMDVGWKAACASMSDIAALGGEPVCAMIALSFAGAPSKKLAKGIVGGAIDAFLQYNCALVGGDVSKGKGGVGLTVAVAGIPSLAGPVLRSGACAGDLIAVTGFLGESAAGLEILKSGEKSLLERFPGLVESHLRPRPRIVEGQLIARMRASALEDISDGLSSDIANICRESDVGCEISTESIPLSTEVLRLAEIFGLDPLAWALEGGEDYELVFTCSSSSYEEIEKDMAQLGSFVTKIGTITSDCELKLLRDGKFEEIGKGYDHFR